MVSIPFDSCVQSVASGNLFLQRRQERRASTEVLLQAAAAAVAGGATDDLGYLEWSKLVGAKRSSEQP